MDYNQTNYTELLSTFSAQKYSLRGNIDPSDESTHEYSRQFFINTVLLPQSNEDEFSYHPRIENVESSSAGPISRNNEIRKYANKLKNIINDCYFEFGIWTLADDCFIELYQKTGLLFNSLEILSYIVNHNLNDEHLLEGVLHILYNYEYQQIDPFGITIALACTTNHSPIVQDLLLACFEKWNNKDSLDILKALDVKEEWLKEYKHEIIDQIEESIIQVDLVE